MAVATPLLQRVSIQMIFILCCCYFPLSQAVNYASNLMVTNITTSSAILSWTVPDDTTGIDSYVLMKIYEDVNTENHTVADPSTTSYTVTELRYSRVFTYTLVTLDNVGASVGNDTVSFVTLYDPINYYALAAIGIASFILLTWVIMFIMGKKCDPRKHSAKLKTEILQLKLKQRQEKKKKFSSQEM